MTKEKISSEVVKSVSVADTVWNKVKSLKVDLFALPDVPVENYVERVDVEPSKLYLKLKVPAVLPLLEERLRKDYDVVMGQLYCEVSPKV